MQLTQLVVVPWWLTRSLRVVVMLLVFPWPSPRVHHHPADAPPAMATTMRAMKRGDGRLCLGTAVVLR